MQVLNLAENELDNIKPLSKCQLENIIELIDSKLNSKGKIIITAILVDTKVEAVNKLKELNYNPNIMEVNISKGRVLDRGIMMMSENPIAIISAKKR